MTKKQRRTVDPAIMAELLAQPGVKEAVAGMTPDEREFYQELLISQGIYARYLKERNR